MAGRAGSSTFRRAVAGVCLTAMVAAAGGADYFPLAVGNRWAYQRLMAEGPAIEWTVAGASNSSIMLKVDSETVELRDRGDEVDIVLPGEGFGLLYRFAPSASWKHRDWQPCNDDVTAEFDAETETVTTSAGTFADCLRLRFRTLGCMDAGRTDEWWAPGVGLIMWYETGLGGTRAWELAEYAVEEQPPAQPQFVRGDGNADGSINIADAIFILTHLFGSSAKLSCLDAGDANDDGDLNIADPIRLLGHLFAHTGPLPDPFSACGEDRTADVLACASFRPCEPSCGDAIEAIARETSIVGSYSAVVRLGYLTKEIIGWQLFCGKYAQATEESARAQAEADTRYGADGTMLNPADPPDAYVFYEPPGDFGGAAVVSARTGLSLFGGSIVWMGTGEITYPISWRSASELGQDCPAVEKRPEIAGYNLDGGIALEPAEAAAALEVVWKTAIPQAFATSGYIFDAVVLLYPRGVGAFDPSTAEWIVILNGGWLE